MKKIDQLNMKRKQVRSSSMKSAVLDAFDALFSKGRGQQGVGKPQRLDTDAETRRKARQLL